MEERIIMNEVLELIYEIGAGKIRNTLVMYVDIEVGTKVIYTLTSVPNIIHAFQIKTQNKNLNQNHCCVFLGEL